MNHRNVTRFLLVTLALPLLLLLLACGAGKHSLLGRLASGPGGPAPVQTELELSAVLADLGLAQAPPGVDPGIYAQLCSELARLLPIYHSERIVCAPPSGPENEIVDFAFADNGNGTHTFTWSYFNVGDYNQDGAVSIADVTPIAMHFLQSAQDPDVEVVDGNRDDVVNISDVTPLAIHFGNNVHHYVVEGAETPEDEWVELGQVLFSEGTEGSRKRFQASLGVDAERFFRVYAVDSAGTPGATSPMVGVGPAAQADALVNGLTAKFYGAGTDPLAGNVAFCWDFESDGVIDAPTGFTPAAGIDPDVDSGSQSPLHTYPAPGNYTATLYVYDKRGMHSTAQVVVAAYDNTPTDAPPEASALAFDLTGAAPFDVGFVALGDDPDGGDIVSHTWSFGDGSAAASGRQVRHTFNLPGTYRVSVTAEDDEGSLSVAYLTLKVCAMGYIYPPMPPSALVGVISDVGDTPQFLLGGGADMDEGGVSFIWDPGEDTGTVPYSQALSHTYVADGVYYANLDVTDNEGVTSRAGATVVQGAVANVPPSAMVLAYVTEGTQNLRVQFFGWGEDPDGTPVTYSWDFDGDGAYDDFSETAHDPIVVFNATGTYDVSLKVTDGAGMSSYALVRINVRPCLTATDPPPPPGDDPVIAVPHPPIGLPINARCYPPCEDPLCIAHGPDGGVLYVIYSDNGGLDPLRPGDPQVEQIQQFGEILGLAWGPLGELPNSGNGVGGGDVAVPDPTAPDPPPEADLKPWEWYQAFRITRPEDGPPRREQLDLKFKMVREDGSAYATQTCRVLVTHAVAEVLQPQDQASGTGDIELAVEVDPTGLGNEFGFNGLDFGEYVHAYFEVGGEILDILSRDDGLNQWIGTWNTLDYENGPYTIRALLYDIHDPQPGEEGDPGPFWASAPITFNVDNPPDMYTEQVVLTINPMGGTTVGEDISLEVQAQDATGLPAYDEFLDFYVQISPTRSDTMSQLPEDPITLEPRTHERIIQLTDSGGGLYTHSFSSEVAGELAFSVIVVDTRSGDKVPHLVDVEHYQFAPGPVANVMIEQGLTRSGYGPVVFCGTDAYGNVVPNPDPSEFQLTSDNPAIVPSPPKPFSASDNLLVAEVIAGDWGTAQWSIEHLPSGSAVMNVPAGYPPWKAHLEPLSGLPLVPPMPPECEDNQHGMPASYSFDYIFDIRLPEPMLNGWNNFEVVIRWPITAPIAYQSHKSLLQDFAVSPMPPEDGGDGWWYLHVGGGSVIPGTEYLGETSVFSVSFSTLAVPDVTECQFEVCPATFQIQDSEGFPVFEDDGSYPLEYYWLPFSVKPTKTLHMHIYRVEGSATNAQIADDVQAAEDSFNLNALLCTLGFYVDFTYEITTISTDAWGRIDEDGDGLDRYDANGDGDYADPGDNNDLFNAMNEGFYDVGANTENIYYVPGIRGGAMGTTYWPNQQVAIDNSTDSDNLTLAHEKVHEMDLRKDGDFDVLDGADMNDEEDGIQRDPAAEGQGAYGSGNLLNYSDTGPLLSGTQAGELDP